MKEPLQVFCCYAREDQQYLYELKSHLMALQRENLIEIKADIDINPGTEWEREINHHLEKAHIILLLISADFIASDYCYEKEMRQALVRHEQGTACVVPIIIRPTDWQRMPFGNLQALPKDAKPIVKWQDRDSAFLSVTEGIRTIVQEFTSNTHTYKQKEPPSWKLVKEGSPSSSRQERNSMDNSNKIGDINISGSGQHSIRIEQGKVINEQHNTYYASRKDGIRSLEKGSKALWNGDYPSAKKELRVAIEEIDGEDQPREASKAHYFLALALLGGKLPRIQVREVMQSIEFLMNNAIKIYPYASYYRIFARIKEDFFMHNGFNDRLNEVVALDRRGVSSPRCADDDENEDYFQHCQPRLQI
jgi:hypothetical protein